jgi:HPt (histidine-containing phosphotransfer) domain-containing protein
MHPFAAIRPIATPRGRVLSARGIFLFAGTDERLLCFGMAQPLPPNEAVAELVHAMGDDDVRTLVRTFLRDFPNSMRELATADRKNGRRLAHRMKSESRMMGATHLSRRMLEIQERLTPETGAEVTPADLAAIATEFEEIAAALRGYVGD